MILRRRITWANEPMVLVLIIDCERLFRTRSGINPFQAGRCP